MATQPGIQALGILRGMVIADIALPAQLQGRGHLPLVHPCTQPGGYQGFFERTVTAVIPDDRHLHAHRRRQRAAAGPEAAVQVEVGQGFIVGVQVQHHVGVGGQLHQAFCQC